MLRPRASVPPVLLAALLLAAPAAARADGFIQTERLHRASLLSLAWEYGVPTLGLRADLVSRGSPAGADLGVRFGVSRRLSLGAALTWNGFTQGGDPRSSFQALSLRGQLHLYLSSSEFQPYLGLFGGGAYLEAIQGAGPTQVRWAPVAGPELGFLVTVGNGLALVLAGRWEMAFTTMAAGGDPASPSVRFPAWASAQVGVAFY